MWTSPPLLLAIGPLSVFALVLAIKEVPGVFFFLVTQPVGFWGVPADGHMQVKGTAHQGGHLPRGWRCVPWLVLYLGSRDQI